MGFSLKHFFEELERLIQGAKSAENLEAIRAFEPSGSRAMNKERLLNVAKACRESPKPDRFDMGRFGHGCNTPACAIGHYALRKDLQDEFYLIPAPSNPDRDAVLKARSGDDAWKAMRTHFGLTNSQVNELFEADGCGEPNTANEAAQYIESFVAEHS